MAQMASGAEGAAAPQFMGVKELAVYLGVSPSWLYQYGTQLGLPRYKFGRGRTAKVRYRRSEVDRWVKSQRVV
ncbi:helix-turn-helix domain-containing protein [Streptomyces globisporus]|uniref:helix-turn-helix transcriptional regulator n=1 Tax=Streptomyces globisporus TaxID=1908 RepID=UPI0009962476